MRLAKLIMPALIALMLVLPRAAYAEMPDISAGQTEFDIFTGCYTLKGNVRVAQGDRVITASEAKANIVTKEVWAEGDVTLVQEGMTLRCDSVYVQGDASLAEVTGNVRFEQEGAISVTSDSGRYQWDTRIADFDGNVAYRQEGGEESRCSRLQYQVEEKKILSVDGQENPKKAEGKPSNGKSAKK